MLVWYFRSRSAEERHHAQLRGEAKNVVYRLNAARWSGQLRQVLGEDGAEALNAGAREWLRCKNALDSPVFKAGGANSPWRQAREQAIRSMDSAMAQLVLKVTSGYGSVGRGEFEHLVGEMKGMADETQRLAGKLADRTGRSSGDASGDLRRAMAELKSLSDAEDELAWTPEKQRLSE
jgi:hypothetical protein